MIVVWISLPVPWFKCSLLNLLSSVSTFDRTGRTGETGCEEALSEEG